MLSPEEAARHPHNVARGVYVESEGRLQAAPAPRFDGEARKPGAIPTHGQHTAEIAAGLAQGAASVWRSSAKA
ncbi:hypothetical protein D3C86_1663770 [compost metagenome]